MDRPHAIVVRASEAPVAPGGPTSGMDRRELLSREGAWAGWVRTEPAIAGGWHHHGERDSYVFVARGTIAVDFGPGGRQRVEATAGDFIFNPAGMVHREVTGAQPVELFVIRVGGGPLNVNVEGPEADEG